MARERAAQDVDGEARAGGLAEAHAEVEQRAHAESRQQLRVAGFRRRMAGDRVRDAYEMELLHEFMESGKAVLGKRRISTKNSERFFCHGI